MWPLSYHWNGWSALLRLLQMTTSPGHQISIFIHNSKGINGGLLSVCGCARARQRDLRKCGRVWIKFSEWADRLHFEHFIYGGGGTRDNFGPRTYSHNWRKTTRFSRICRHGDAGSPFWESALLLHEMRPLTSAILVFNSETKHFPISVLCGSNRSTPDKDSTRESKTRIVYSCPWLRWILIDFLN